MNITAKTPRNKKPQPQNERQNMNQTEHEKAMFQLARYAIKEKACDCLGWNENSILDGVEDRAKYPTPEDAIDTICNWAMHDGCIDPRFAPETVLAATHFYGYERARRSAAFRILKLDADMMAEDNNWPADWRDTLRARYGITNA